MKNACICQKFFLGQMGNNFSVGRKRKTCLFLMRLEKEVMVSSKLIETHRNSSRCIAAARNSDQVSLLLRFFSILLDSK